MKQETKELASCHGLPPLRDLFLYLTNTELNLTMKMFMSLKK